MVVIIVFFYLLLALLGIALTIWRESSRVAFDAFALPTDAWMLPVGASLVIVLGVHLFFVRAVERWEMFKKSARDIRIWLGDLSEREMLIVSISSALGEEFFFRGWLLNETGLIISSVIFGLVHLPPNRNWYYWPFFAALMGVCLGSVCLWTDTLVYAFAIHAGINFLNLRRMAMTKH
jgi:membrane protease YdiL (CAAX protease family)